GSLVFAGTYFGREVSVRLLNIPEFQNTLSKWMEAVADQDESDGDRQFTLSVKQFTEYSAKAMYFYFLIYQDGKPVAFCEVYRAYDTVISELAEVDLDDCGIHFVMYPRNQFRVMAGKYTAQL